MITYKKFWYSKLSLKICQYSYTPTNILITNRIVCLSIYLGIIFFSYLYIFIDSLNLNSYTTSL